MGPLFVLPLGFFLFHRCVSGSVQEQGYRGPVLKLAYYVCLVGASAIKFHTLCLGLDLIFPNNNNLDLGGNFFGLERWTLPRPEFHAGSWTELGPELKALLPLVVVFPLYETLPQQIEISQHIS